MTASNCIRILKEGEWKVLTGPVVCVKRAIAILRHVRNTLERYFKTVERIRAPTGRSKILLCRN
jgi:hypothetical protein